MSCTFSFDIAAWQAVSDRMADAAQWQAWAANPALADTWPEHKPDLAFLPPMQRRRLSTAARLMCAAAWPLADAHPDAALVFASHDGEINRSFDLWPELLRSHTVSPTSFGLSVHNALPGQWSMLRQDMREHTALAVGADGLESTLAEACALLQEGCPEVLAVWVDEPLSTDYAVAAERAPVAYALAMVIRPGSRYRLTLAAGEDQGSDAYWGALEWIRFMLAGSPETLRRYGRRHWHWQQNAADAA
ncbi:hypothetical protein L1281_001346 [Neisseria sp. HSC-16F19]|nr:beta-ketoacyl synthase chain length factor [Neisseria sp. HSC-16F19]MCP2040757.1 hypothetical protein [Neisseria sp. HSC-16F19]